MGRENNLEILFTPTFIKFVEHYAAKFIAYEKSGHKYSRWLHEYEDLYKRGMFKPTIIRDQYIKMLKNEFQLGYIRGTVFWYIGINAHDATKAYFDKKAQSSKLTAQSSLLKAITHLNCQHPTLCYLLMGDAG
mgnify:CR=1 FL=1